MARRLLVLTRMLLLVVALTSLLALAVAGIEDPTISPFLSCRGDGIPFRRAPGPVLPRGGTGSI